MFHEYSLITGKLNNTFWKFVPSADKNSKEKSEVIVTKTRVMLTSLNRKGVVF